MKNLLAITLGLLAISSIYAQVPNDACTGAIDYGILDGRMNFPAPNGANYDTCFHVSNIGAVPNFPFFYSNSFCGLSPTMFVNGAENDVWYKLTVSGNFSLFAYPSQANNFADSIKLKFWADGGAGTCGSFIGGASQLIDFTQQNYLSESYNYIPFSSTNAMYLQISGFHPSDTVDFNLCLVSGNFSPIPVCSIGGTSAYDSLCFITNTTFVKPTSNSSADGSITTTTSSGYPPYSFSWNTGDTTASLSALTSGIYNLTITDSTGCSNSYNFDLTLPSSSSELTATQLRVYPNPTSSILYLHTTGEKKITIQTLEGKTELQVVTQSSQIDISCLPEGLYLLTLQLPTPAPLQLRQKLFIAH